MLVRPLVSVVVPCRNEAAQIRRCLESLVEQQAVTGGFEIIVADGMSDDGTREILRELAARHPELKVVDNPQQITPCGMNVGIGASRGHWIAIIGAHGRYSPDYLARCLEVAEQTGAQNIGGAMICEGHGRVQRAIAAAHHSPFSVGGARWHQPQYEGPADTVFGGFYQRQVFERIGLFDEELVRNQDDEFNLRLIRAGGTIWQSPRIRCWYEPRASLIGLFRQYEQYGYWKVRVIQKHKLPASWRHVMPAAFLVALGLQGSLGLVGFLVALLTAWPAGPAFACALSTLAGIGLYLVAALAASVLVSLRSDWSILPILPLVFICYHWGYGFGFLRGVWDFALRKRPPGQQFVCITRSGREQHETASI